MAISPKQKPPAKSRPQVQSSGSRLQPGKKCPRLTHPHTREQCFQVLLGFNQCIKNLTRTLANSKSSKFSRLASSLQSEGDALSKRAARIIGLQEDVGRLDLLDKWQLCNLLSISIDTLKSYKRKPDFPAGYDIGGKRQWLWDEIRDWILSHPWDEATSKLYTERFSQGKGEA